MFRKFIDPKKITVGFCILILLLVCFYPKKVLAEKADIPYLIKVNRICNTITVYEKDDNGKYSVPVKAMVCSVGRDGTETKLGTYKTQEKYRWKELMNKVWGQYSTRIVGGILFHSVYYYENGNPGSLSVKEYNKLGQSASHGCIRLTVADAKWIYSNCPLGTTVIIYDDKSSPGPLGKPTPIKITKNISWDPTDPDERNPYKSKNPFITGAKSQSIPWGGSIDLMKGIKAVSSMGKDITSWVRIKGKVNAYKPGKYNVTYTVEDELGKTANKKVTINVKEFTDKIKVEGIKDRYVGKDAAINRDLALEGIKAYSNGKALSRKYIDVTFEVVSDSEYIVTYKIVMNDYEVFSKCSTIYVDSEAPEITGVSDRLLEQEQIVDRDFALQDIKVSDNHTKLELSDINVSIEENADGSGYLVTYEVSDEFGNRASQTAMFQY